MKLATSSLPCANPTSSFFCFSSGKKAFFPEEKQKKLLVGFAQGRDDVANFIEKQLKTLFVQSMKRVERHVCNEGRSKSLNRLLHHLGHAKKNEDNHQQLQQFLEPLLDIKQGLKKLLQLLVIILIFLSMTQMVEQSIKRL